MPPKSKKLDRSRKQNPHSRRINSATIESDTSSNEDDGGDEAGSSDDDEPGIFDGLTAWFSSTVDQLKKQRWIDHGGKEVDSDAAMFVFSQDATAADTQVLFQSDAYLEEHLAVFHPDYIDESVRQGDAKKVPIGKFFLPEANLHEAIKDKIVFNWEKLQRNQQKRLHRTYGQHSLTTQKVQLEQNDKMKSARPEMGTGDMSMEAETEVPIVDIDDMPKVDGDISDFVVGKDGCEVFQRK